MDERSVGGRRRERIARGRMKVENSCVVPDRGTARVQTWLNKLMQSNGRKRYLQLCQSALCTGERAAALRDGDGKQREMRERGYIEKKGRGERGKGMQSFRLG